MSNVDTSGVAAEVLSGADLWGRDHNRCTGDPAGRGVVDAAGARTAPSLWMDTLPDASAGGPRHRRLVHGSSRCPGRRRDLRRGVPRRDGVGAPRTPFPRARSGHRHRHRAHPRASPRCRVSLVRRAGRAQPTSSRSWLPARRRIPTPISPSTPWPVSTRRPGIARKHGSTSRPRPRSRRTGRLAERQLGIGAASAVATISSRSAGRTNPAATASSADAVTCDRRSHRASGRAKRVAQE